MVSEISVHDQDHDLSWHWVMVKQNIMEEPWSEEGCSLREGQEIKKKKKRE